MEKDKFWYGAARYAVASVASCGDTPGMHIRTLACLLILATYSVPAQTSLPPALHADQVIVLKKDHTLQLLAHGRVVRNYKVALGGDPTGAKTRQGDHKTPEGNYTLDYRNSHSQFYKSIHISYPNAQQREAARKLGVSAGGDVFVHGLPAGYGFLGASHRLKDWTDGCIAVTNEEMDQIWGAVKDGTPIEIRP